MSKLPMLADFRDRPLEGLVDLSRHRLERGSVPSMVWPPQYGPTGTTDTWTDQVTQTGVPCCVRHSQIHNLTLRDPYRIARQYCAFCDGEET